MCPGSVGRTGQVGRDGWRSGVWRRDQLVVVANRGNGENALPIGRARQHILGLHDIVIRAACGGARAVSGPAVVVGSAVCLLCKQVHRELRRKINHLRVVRQSLRGLQEIVVQGGPEAERPSGADHVDVQNIHFRGGLVLQPSLAYCNRFAGSRSHSSDGQRVLEKIAILYRIDREKMEVDIVQGQGNVGADVVQQASGSNRRHPSAETGAQLWG